MTTHSTLADSPRPHRVRPSVWTVGSMLLAIPVAVPILAILSTFALPATEVWLHLRESVLLEYVGNTLLLLMLVGFMVAVLGIGPAWLVANLEFPGRTVLAWALIVPIAAPAYVVAYAYADLLAYTGPIQSMLRELGLAAGALPSIRSLPGAAFVLSVTLFPYVYLFAFNAFSAQARPLSEAAKMLGAKPGRVFFRVALPHARPAIAGGVALALMEAAADFGVVEFFGVPTLTNGIFRTWYAQGEHQAAMQMAGWLFLVVAVLIVFEQMARRGSHANPVSRNVASARTAVRGWRGVMLALVCALPFLMGFAIPGMVLMQHAILVGDPFMGPRFLGYLGNSTMVAGIAALVATLCAVWLSYSVRLARQSGGGWLLGLSVRVASLGYAIPGMVLAVGLIGPLTSLDKWIAGFAADNLGIRTGLLLTGSIAALIFVYLARFLTVAYNSCDGGMERIHTHYDAAARSLGAAPWRLLRRIHLPILTPAILTSILLVFVDVVKELPATLILRPFNFETLATRAYRLASDERIAEASTAALSIIAVGLIPAALIAWQTFGAKKNNNL